VAYAQKPAVNSPVHLHESLEEICISLADLYKWSFDLCISFGEIGISAEEIHKWKREIGIFLEETPQPKARSCYLEPSPPVLILTNGKGRKLLDVREPAKIGRVKNRNNRSDGRTLSHAKPCIREETPSPERQAPTA